MYIFPSLPWIIHESRVLSSRIWGLNSVFEVREKSTESILTKLAEKQVYESLQPLRSKSRKCSVRFYVVAITRFRNSPNFQQRSRFTFPFFATFLDELLSRIQKSRQSCMNDCVKSTVPVSRFWFLSLDPLINLPFRKSNQNRLGRFRACRNYRLHPSTFEIWNSRFQKWDHEKVRSWKFEILEIHSITFHQILAPERTRVGEHCSFRNHLKLVTGFSDKRIYV